MKKYTKRVILIGMQFSAIMSFHNAFATGFSSSDADTAMSAFITSYYDSYAKYFYADNTRSNWDPFWIEAQNWDIVMDAYQRTNSATYKQMIDDVYDGFMSDYTDMGTACNTTNSFTLSNPYNDDIGWWAKGSIRAYNLTGEPRYLHCAQRLFDYIYTYWDTTADGGGIWWTQTNASQKNVCTNAPAAITAANLSIALSNPTYLTKAQNLYNWVKTNLTDQKGTVWDDYNGGALYKWQYTYNYGTFIGAAVALYQATNNAAYLTDAAAAATLSLTNVATNGILNDEGSGAGAFKGIYVRYLNQYANLTNATNLTQFLQNNANAAWNNRRTADNLMGSNWAVPAPSGTLAVDTAGSAVAVLQDTPTTTNPTTITLQAENGILHNLSTESIYQGYHGTGYVAGWNQDGQWVDIVANVPTAGLYNLTLRFATGAGVASRNITINGCSAVNNISFPNTGSWSSYSTIATNNISLRAGNNTISIMYNSTLGSTNYLNLDEITLAPQ